MKPSLIWLTIAVTVTLVVPAAFAQRLRRGGDREALFKKHLEECEVCAKTFGEIEEIKADLAELQNEREKLRAARLEAEIKELAEQYPEAKEQLEQLLTLYNKAAEVRDELEDIAASGREILEELDLELEDRAALLRALGVGREAIPGDQELIRMRAHRVQLRAAREKRPELAERLEHMDAEKTERLKRLKEQDPEAYEIAVKEQELTEKLLDLQASLRDTMIEHLRNAAHPGAR